MRDPLDQAVAELVKLRRLGKLVRYGPENPAPESPDEAWEDGVNDSILAVEKIKAETETDSARAAEAERRNRQLLLAVVCALGRGMPLHLSEVAFHAHGGPNPGHVETLVEPRTNSIALVAACDHGEGMRTAEEPPQ